ELLQYAGRGEREVALRVRGRGPHLVAPRVDAERLDPVRVRRGQIVGHVLAATEGDEAGAELALIERLSAAFRHRRQRACRPGAADHGPGPHGPRPPTAVGAG